MVRTVASYCAPLHYIVLGGFSAPDAKPFPYIGTFMYPSTKSLLYIYVGNSVRIHTLAKLGPTIMQLVCRVVSIPHVGW